MGVPPPLLEFRRGVLMILKVAAGNYVTVIDPLNVAVP
jgi:hypothetical protein